MKARNLGLAVKVVRDSWPMLLAAVARKIARLFHPQTRPIVIPAEPFKAGSS